MSINITGWHWLARRSLVVFMFLGPGWILLILGALIAGLKAFIASMAQNWADTVDSVPDIWQKNPWWSTRKQDVKVKKDDYDDIINASC
jgi:hypothetical protein